MTVQVVLGIPNPHAVDLADPADRAVVAALRQAAVKNVADSPTWQNGCQDLVIADAD